MKKLTKLWLELISLIEEIDDIDLFNTQIYEQFKEIFDVKEVREYKRFKDTRIISPLEFELTTDTMKRAFVEGYLLAQMEQKRNDIKDLYNIYKKDIKNEILNTSTTDMYDTLSKCHRPTQNRSDNKT